MALIQANRVRETSTTTGTGALTLLGALDSSYQTFLAAIGDGNTCRYMIVLSATSWEAGIGTYASGANTLTRTTVTSGSNGTSPVNFGAGTKAVFVDISAEGVPDVQNSGSEYTANAAAFRTNVSASPLPDGTTLDSAGAGSTLEIKTGGVGATQIAAAAVTNAKLANIAAHSYKGNNTGAGAVPADITNIQLAADLPAMVGDSGSGGTKGLVPAPPSGSTAAGDFLRADGTWAVPSGGGGSYPGVDGTTLDTSGAGATIEVKPLGITAAQIAANTVTSAKMSNVGPGVTGPIGSTTTTPVVTIDAAGRVTGLTSATITPAPVSSVAGRTGAVVLSNTDISGLGTAAVLNTGTANGLVALSGLTINNQVGTSYNFVLGDANIQVTGNNAAAQTFTIPPNSSVAYVIGDVIEVLQLGAGIITIAPGAGVTLNSSSAIFTTPNQYASIYLEKTGTNTWVMTGNGLLQTGNALSELTGVAGTARTNIGAAPVASPTFTGTTTAPEFTASGLTGAVAASRYVGATASGAPGSGTFATGDFVIDQTGFVWVCSAGGSPGTWVKVGGSGTTWNDVTGTTQAALVGNGYVADNAALVTITLPSTAVFGSVIPIVGKGAGGWKIAQNAGQTCSFGNKSTTTGVTGSLASTNANDCVDLICTTANSGWTVRSSVGNITVV